ncbi:uncharacterized protein [Lepeophtheirus salmonis]|uniref:uncharacterized protein n=1 Tax=Lepeophtheirus salmonis TaxID=72036 RepID=UPI001AE8396C|nr:uncharacterized protein LOC121115465 [Lepeophtheirus salmonis]
MTRRDIRKRVLMGIVSLLLIEISSAAGTIPPNSKVVFDWALHLTSDMTSWRTRPVLDGYFEDDFDHLLNYVYSAWNSKFGSSLISSSEMSGIYSEMTGLSALRKAVEVFIIGLDENDEEEGPGPHDHEGHKFKPCDYTFLGSQVDLTSALSRPRRSKRIDTTLRKICSSSSANQETIDACLSLSYIQGMSTLLRVHAINLLKSSTRSNDGKFLKALDNLLNSSLNKLYHENEDLFSSLFKEFNTFTSCTIICPLYERGTPKWNKASLDGSSLITKEQRLFMKMFLSSFLDPEEQLSQCYNKCVAASPLVLLLEEENGESVSSSDECVSSRITYPGNFILDTKYDQAVGGIVNGDIIICSTDVGLCYTLDVNSRWQASFSQFPEGKTIPVPFVTSKSAFTVIGDGTGLWVTGGERYGPGANPFKTTHIYQNGNWKAGPNLPIALYSHCLVHINESFTFLAGGYMNEKQEVDKAWAYDWTSHSWRDLPPMPHPTNKTLCSIMNDEGDVLLSGIDHGFIYNSTTNTWIHLPPGGALPMESRFGGSMAYAEGGVRLFGGSFDPRGSSNYVFRFSESDLKWIQRDGSLMKDRKNVLAISVPLHKFRQCS